MAAPPKSKLDANQVLQSSFDDATGELRVNASLSVGGGTEVIINHADDSIKIGDGTNLIGSTLIGGRYKLDVAASIMDGSGNTFNSTSGSLNVAPQDVLMNGLTEADAIDIDESAGTFNSYTYYLGGLAGTLLGTITINFTNSSKNTIDSVVRT